MSDVSDMDTCLAWEAPEPHRRTMGVMFERDITPTEQLASGFVRVPVQHEQPKLSRHPGEEVYFVVSGEGIFDRGDRSDRVHARGAVYVAPFSPHRWINVGAVDLEIFYVVSPSAFGAVGGYLDVVAGWREVSGGPGRGVEKSVDVLDRERTDVAERSLGRDDDLDPGLAVGDRLEPAS